MLPGIKLTDIEMRYITVFEGLTGATALDCVVDKIKNRVIFVVKPGQAGLAIGPAGINLKKIREFIKKDIEVVEYSDNPRELIKNCFIPARVLNIRIVSNPNGRKIAYVTVPNNQRGLAIGREGRRIARAKILAKRYFGIDNVLLTRQSF